MTRRRFWSIFPASTRESTDAILANFCARASVCCARAASNRGRYVNSARQTPLEVLTESNLS